MSARIDAASAACMPSISARNSCAKSSLFMSALLVAADGCVSSSIVAQGAAGTFSENA